MGRGEGDIDALLAPSSAGGRTIERESELSLELSAGAWHVRNPRSKLTPAQFFCGRSGARAEDKRPFGYPDPRLLCSACAIACARPVMLRWRLEHGDSVPLDNHGEYENALVWAGDADHLHLIEDEGEAGIYSFCGLGVPSEQIKERWAGDPPSYEQCPGCLAEMVRRWWESDGQR